MWKRDIVIRSRNNRNDNRYLKKHGITRTDFLQRLNQGKNNCQKWINDRKSTVRHKNLNPVTVNDDFIHPNFDKVDYGELIVKSTGQTFNKDRVFEIKLQDRFALQVFDDMKATNLFNEIRTLLGVSKQKGDGNVDDLNLSYPCFWNMRKREETPIIKECWKVISPGKNAWKNDIRYIYPKDELTHHYYLNRLYIYGVGKLLDSICDINESPKLKIFSAGIIVVSRNNPEHDPYWHSDHIENYSKLWNVLIPIDLPVTNTVELFIKDVTGNGRKVKNRVYSYKYRKPTDRVNYGLVWNGGVDHATNRKSGSTGDPRIMLCLCAGELPVCRQLLTYTDIERQLFGWTKVKMHNLRSVLSWQDELYHSKGQSEYEYEIESDKKPVASTSQNNKRKLGDL